MNKGLALFATDKDVFDCLMGKSGGAFSEGALRNIASRRGIFFGDGKSREEMCLFLASLSLSIPEIEEIFGKIHSRADRKNTTTKVLKVPPKMLDLEKVRRVIDRVSRGGHFGTVRPSSQGETSIEAKGIYVETDLSRTLLSQRRNVEYGLKVSLEEDALVLRCSDDATAKELRDEISRALKEEVEEDFDEQEINVCGIHDSEIRSEFFLNLIRAVEDSGTEDAKIIKAKMARGTEVMDEEEENEIGRVLQAALDGESIANSRLYRQLKNRGFFLYYIRFTVLDPAKDFDKIEITCQFKCNDHCSDFVQEISKYFNRKKDGGYVISGKKLPPFRKDQYLTILEQAARMALHGVGR